ncbi:hypothetical protein NKH48_28410 [Mesorhizobium sp. M1233]|uniref:hypothetical protein n=1 Tax=Mesorhizobium sp. M1233 TaxID=2957072 RepID=UPI00333524E7
MQTRIAGKAKIHDENQKLPNPLKKHNNAFRTGIANQRVALECQTPCRLEIGGPSFRAIHDDGRFSIQQVEVKCLSMPTSFRRWTNSLLPSIVTAAFFQAVIAAEMRFEQR